MALDPDLTPIREAHRFDESRLTEYLREHLDGFRGELTIRQFEGGQSNPTFLLESGGTRWVMRKKPPGELLASAHAVEREYRVMHALQTTDVPVPRVDCLCEDDAVIGTPFFVMEMVEGRIIPSIMEADVSPAHRRSLHEEAIRVLAALHTVDYQAVGLGEFGRPGNYFERQISRWSRQYRASETETIPGMDRLIDWLPDHVPDDEAAAIVHGDYSIRNTVVHATEPRIQAVLDWELSTIGHPLGDLAYFCILYHLPRLVELDLGALGVPTEAELVNLYCELTGRGAIHDWPFYMAYCMFRLASISQGVYKRGLDGNASSETAINAIDGVRSVAHAGWQLVSDEG